MKKILKNTVKPGALMIICFLTSMRLIDKKPDFSGAWRLNTEKTKFGGLPSTGVGRQLNIKQYSDKLIIQRRAGANGPGDSITIDTFKFNFRKEPVADMFKHHIAYSGWFDDGKHLTKIVFSQHAVQDARTSSKESIEQKTMVTWSLSADGKTLTIDEDISLSNGMGFPVLLVYDKQDNMPAYKQDNAPGNKLKFATGQKN